ncbi:hypothetical protein NE237_013811 [Protea cynaroides]|uniref:Major facilitator superfamily (MFS) profile domain-containing protein n=1 Tax=Protea cynaroides TaxID=273540 RepID=A0A9Q0H024_9MAGN|nr:hypothetical protein NE237_013811 [Protea cynaroides]
MAIEQDMEAGENKLQEELKEPLLQSGGDGASKGTKERMSMVYFSTFVAVCGAFEFGSCVGFSSPTQSAIRTYLDLSLAEYSLFGSILNFGAMIGAITSGTIANFIGRKEAMRISAICCIAGWFAIYFAEGALPLDIGRLFTGYGIGVFSYVAKMGRQREFAAALQKLRGKDADIAQEAAEIQIVPPFLCLTEGGSHRGSRREFNNAAPSSIELGEKPGNGVGMDPKLEPKDSDGGRARG